MVAIKEKQSALTWWTEGLGWPSPVGTGAKLMAGSGKCCCGSGAWVGGGTEPTDRPGCRGCQRLRSAAASKTLTQPHTQHPQRAVSHSPCPLSCQGHFS